jgi:abequosyltransferase
VVAEVDAAKLLTIAIPTYNRVTYLEEGLEHVLSQLGPDDADVEILVSDNASNDATPRLMREMTQNHPEIRYLRNASNIGPERNFLNCLRAAKGRFVHLLSDDDILLAGSVAKIKECIRANPGLNFIFLNICSFDKVFDPHKAYPKFFDLSGPVIVNRQDQILEYLHIYLTFVSALVFNQESFGRINNPEQYVGTQLLQSHLALQCIAGGQSAILSHVCVAGRADNSSGYDFYQVFIGEWKKVLFQTGLQAGFSKAVLTKVFTKTLHKYIRPMVKRIRRAHNDKFGMQKKILFKHSWNYWEAWLYVYPYAFLPRFLWTGGRNAKMSWKGEKRSKK